MECLIGVRLQCCLGGVDSGVGRQQAGSVQGYLIKPQAGLVVFVNCWK